MCNPITYTPIYVYMYIIYIRLAIKFARIKARQIFAIFKFSALKIDPARIARSRLKRFYSRTQLTLLIIIKANDSNNAIVSEV